MEEQPERNILQYLSYGNLSLKLCEISLNQTLVVDWKGEICRLASF